MLAPTIGLLLGALFVLWRIDLPPVLQAYPLELTARFFLALLLAYAVSFALQYLAGRRATLVILLLLIGIGPLMGLIASVGGSQAIATLSRWLFEWPGPFAIFTEPWRLIDV